MAHYSEVELGLPSSLLSGIKEVFGCFLLGTVLSAVVYGVSLLQAYTYFRNSSQDSKYLRVFVAILFTLDTIAMALNIDGLYEFFVTDFGDLLLLTKLPRSMEFLYVLTVLMDTLMQCFFACRLWALSGRNIALVSSIAFVALCSFALGTASWIILVTSADQFASLVSLQMRTLWGLVSGLGVLCDVLIVAGLCYYLHSKKTGFPSTNSIIDRLIVYAINRGVLTAMCGVGWVVTTVALPGRFLDVPFGLLTQHLYLNTLLATLNAQRSLRRGGDDVVELGTQTLDRLNAPTGGSVNRRSHGAEDSERGPGEPERVSDSTSTFQVIIDISADKTTQGMTQP